jgi:6-pyruvoyl-tetrahydropterin synthase
MLGRPIQAKVIMFSVTVRSHVMIAHSFKGELFGIAQRLHGATYVVDVEFRRAELGIEGVVVDIGRASTALQDTLSEFNFRNLDELPELRDQNTTTEFMAKLIFERMARRAAQGDFGPGSSALHSMRVTLHESHVAWASYEGPLTS